MSFLYFLLVGLIAGWLAGQIMKGSGYGVLGDIVIGIVGAIISGWLFGVLGLVEPDPANPTSSTYTTSYTYDAWGNLAGVSMPRGSTTQTRTFTYSGSLLQSATNPENGTVSYTYNSMNKVATPPLDCGAP